MDPDFDQKITRRFRLLHQMASQGRLDWEKTADEARALVIILDQFSRNIYRKQAKAFAFDHQAQSITLRAIDHGFDMAFSENRSWFYMPLMHAESEILQTLSVRFFRERVGNTENIKFAESHADLISRFGRFPYRNKVLGRKNTPEEEAFLAEQPASWGQ